MSSRKSARPKSGRPKQGAKDAEELTAELDQLKRKFTTVRQDNVYMRTQVQRMSAQLRKKDKQIQNVLSIKVSGISDRTTDAAVSARLQALKSEMMSVSRLTAKVRDLEVEVAEKDEELKLLKSSMKFTLIKELQIEAQTYFNEARRMKKLLDKAGRQGESRSSRSLVHNSKSRDAWRGLDEGGQEELMTLREEVKVLRRESVYLRSEREMEDKSYNILANLKTKINSLTGELSQAQEHINSMDDSRGSQHRLAEVIHRNETDSRPVSRQASRQNSSRRLDKEEFEETRKPPAAESEAEEEDYENEEEESYADDTEKASTTPKAAAAAEPKREEPSPAPTLSRPASSRSVKSVKSRGHDDEALSFLDGSGADY